MGEQHTCSRCGVADEYVERLKDFNTFLHIPLTTFSSVDSCIGALKRTVAERDAEIAALRQWQREALPYVAWCADDAMLKNGCFGKSCAGASALLAQVGVTEEKAG